MAMGIWKNDRRGLTRCLVGSFSSASRSTVQLRVTPPVIRIWPRSIQIADILAHQGLGPATGMQSASYGVSPPKIALCLGSTDFSRVYLKRLPSMLDSHHHQLVIHQFFPLFVNHLVHRFHHALF